MGLTTPKSKVERWIYPWVLLGLGGVTALYCLELFFRSVLIRPVVPATEQAFRDQIASQWLRPIPLEKTPGTIRILGLADSFGLAGEDQNYHYLVERQLQEKGFPVEMVNLSIPGIGPASELRLLKRFGARYRPDLVLHSLFVGNDFIVHSREPFEYRGIYVRPHRGLTAFCPMKFALAQWIYNAFRTWHNQRLLDLEWAAGRGENHPSFLPKEVFLEVARAELNCCLTPNAAYSRWQPVLKLLDETRRETQAMGAGYLLVIHPSQVQVDQELRRRVQEKHRLSLEQYDGTLPQRLLKEYGTSQGVPVVDLLPDFQAHPVQEELYLVRDTHYSLKGNRLAAEKIADFLEENRPRESGAPF